MEEQNIILSDPCDEQVDTHITTIYLTEKSYY